MISTSQVCETIAQWLTESEPHPVDWSPKAWETFQFASRVHGVAPLLHCQLKEVSWLDEPIKTWLAEQYQFNCQRLAKMQEELRQLLALFSQNGLPLIPLKGSILTATYYQDAGLRPMADLDLLIRPEDFSAAVKLLAQLGYRQETVHWKHTEFVKPDNRQVVSTTHEHPDNPRKLEIHLRCRETFGGPIVELTGLIWQNAVPGHLLGEAAWLIKPDVLWLHLLVHATYHAWQGKGRLLHLVDLTQLISYLDNPLPYLNSADARFTYPSLALLQKYFPGVLAGEMLAVPRAQVSPAFRQWVTSLDLVNTSYLNPRRSGLYLIKALKFTEGRPREVAQALRFAALPSLEEIALDHPQLAQSKAPWLAYFLLPLDWAKRIVNREL